jgi:hypothetical protein
MSPMTAVSQFDWASCDPSEAAETVVLLGAGASADAGLPVAAQLHTLLLERLPALYGNLADLVFEDGQPVDVERLFRVVQFIHTLETTGRPLDLRVRDEGLDIARLVKEWQPELQTYLEGQVHVERGSPTGRLIDVLWDVLWDILWLAPNQTPDLNYLGWLLMTMRGGTIVTLNYDNCLEQTALYGSALQLDTGPYPRPRDVDVPGYSGATAIRVVKLHGSLNWTTDAETGYVSELVDNEVFAHRLAYRTSASRPPIPGIIFGAGNKLRPDGPYLDLYVEFKQSVMGARRFIIIGYGWGDTHVNEVIRQWTRLRINDRLLRIGSIEPTLRPEQEEWIDMNDTFDLQFVSGRAGETMLTLMKPTPGLQRRRSAR